MTEAEITANPISEHKEVIFRLTGLWALSEAFLGGILHALKIPFTGLILGGVSIIIITAIASLGSEKGIIMRACLTVILIKLIANPYAPVAAYIAVIMQGLLGELIFLKRNFYLLPALVFGVIVALMSSFQKVFILSIVFGMALWESIDKFTDFVIREVFSVENYSTEFSLSYLLIGAYTVLHLAGGILAGIYAYRITKNIRGRDNEKDDNERTMLKNFVSENINNNFKQREKKKIKYYKSSKIIIFLFLLILLILSYIYTYGNYFNPQSIIIMLLRSLVILVLWFKFISPALSKFLKKKITKRGEKLMGDADRIISSFPVLRQIVRYSWKQSSVKRGVFRLGSFLDRVIMLTLIYDEDT